MKLRQIFPYMGIAEIAEFLGVSTTAVHYYRTGFRRRDIQFPEPIAKLKMGPLWTRDSIVHFKWKLRREAQP